MVNDLATLIGVMELLYDDDYLVWSLTGYGTLGMMKNPMETLMKILIPLKRSWIPLVSLEMVIWHDDVVFVYLMKSWNLVKSLMPITCT